jgi:dihydroorotase
VTRDSLLYKCGWSPFEGHRFNSRIATTIVNGNVVWDGNQVNTSVLGQRLQFRQSF